jgi:transposase
MKPYSEDLRWRVVAAVDGGMPRAEVARVFQISLPSLKRWLRRRRETGTLAPTPVPGPPARKGAVLQELLPARLAAHPDATLADHCGWFFEARREPVSTATMSRAIARLGWTRKKSR